MTSKLSLIITLVNVGNRSNASRYIRYRSELTQYPSPLYSFLCVNLMTVTRYFSSINLRSFFSIESFEKMTTVALLPVRRKDDKNRAAIGYCWNISGPACSIVKISSVRDVALLRIRSSVSCASSSCLGSRTTTPAPRL